MTDEELKAWAEAHWDGGGDGMRVGMRSPLAGGILRLLGELATLRVELQGHVERIAAKSELRSRKAELQRVVVELGPLIPLASKYGLSGELPFDFDGSTGLSNTTAGGKITGSGV
jgi:hypothetical protein